MRLGFLEDANGDRSMGRLMAFIGTMEAVFLACVGTCLAVYEVVYSAEKTAGLALVAASVGIFSSGALLKGWQKASEVKET